jgi:hypothetical protein
MKGPSLTSPYEGREPAIKAKEPEVRRAGGTDGLVGGGNRFCRGKHHLWRPPPQHRRQRPPARQRHTGEWWLPQCALAGPHSRPCHRSEDETIPQHEHRPRGVRRVVRPSGAAGDAGRAMDMAGLRTARPSPVRWTDSHTPTGQQVAVHLPCKAGGRPSPPNARGRSGSPAHAEGRAPTRLALLPSTNDEHP